MSEMQAGQIPGQTMNSMQPPQQPQGPQMQDKGSFFSKSKPQAPDPRLVQMATDMNDLARRLRLMEERYHNFRKKNQVTEQDMLGVHKTLNREIKTVSSDVAEIRKEVMGLEENMGMVLTELSRCAKREDLLMLQKYIDLWEPVHFVTEQGVKRIITDIEKYKNP